MLFEGGGLNAIRKFYMEANSGGGDYSRVGLNRGFTVYILKAVNSRIRNTCVLKDVGIDSFNAAEKIKNIPNNLFEDGYVFVFFDAESLFTNVPLKRTIDILLKRVYQDNLITTNIKKRNLKKLVLDIWTKTSFMSNGKFYNQVDGVSMRSSLGPVLANIIMTELEGKVIRSLISDGTIKLYGR